MYFSCFVQSWHLLSFSFAMEAHLAVEAQSVSTNMLKNAQHQHPHPAIHRPCFLFKMLSNCMYFEGRPLSSPDMGGSAGVGDSHGGGGVHVCSLQRYRHFHHHLQRQRKGALPPENGSDRGMPLAPRPAV